jgi:hypothetical protein
MDPTLKSDALLSSIMFGTFKIYASEVLCYVGLHVWNPDSVTVSTVSIRTRVNEHLCPIRYLGLESGRSMRFFSSPKCPHWLWGRHNLLVSGRLCSLKVKCLVHEAGHSPSSAGVKNEWATPPFPPSAFTACTGTDLPIIFTSNSPTCTKQRSCSKTTSDLCHQMLLNSTNILNCRVAHKGRDTVEAGLKTTCK